MASTKGIGYPFELSAGRLPAAVLDDDAIEASIRQVIDTMRGERAMRPGVGSVVWKTVFGNTGRALEAKLESEVRRAIVANEKRVQVVNVEVVDTEGSIEIVVNYRRAGRLNTATSTIETGGAG